MEKKRKILLLFVALIIFIGGYWLFFIKKEECKTLDCFKEKLLKCEKAHYQREEKFVYEYNIIGKKKDSCVIEVKFVFAGGEPKLERLVGKKMICNLPLGYVEFPEREIDYCTGNLKEEIQYLMIKESYSFLSQSLGRP